MDGLQFQINDLNQKVDQLHQIVERLSGQIMTFTTQQPDSLPSTSHQKTLPPLSSPAISQMETGYKSYGYSSNAYPYEMVGNENSYSQQNGRFRAAMEHKDVLLEDIDPKPSLSSLKEPMLSSDIQIRRLTAQLTAAYNRIAALEEQLLACRLQA